ncbi:MAG: CapA family protein [Deltaproteobacteria bacterium]|nr:CapA family protein [Deltaproteobacteria bacterium]
MIQTIRAGHLGLFAILIAACTRSPSNRGIDSAALPQDASVAETASEPLEDDAATVEEPDAAVATGPRRVVITGAGDIVLHRHVVQIAESFRETGGFSWMLSRLAPIITPREVAIVNLVGPMSSTHRPPWTGPHPALGGPNYLARNLARVGFDAVTLANSHALDQRPEGLEATLDLLDQAGMGGIGAGRSEDDAYAPWITEREGVRVAVVGYTERLAFAQSGVEARAYVARDVSRVLAALTSARDGADVVVACVYWGRDRATSANANQRALARRMVDAGADLVLGNGPSVLQSVERIESPRGDAVVAYSLGTLLSNYGSAWHQGVTERPSSDPMAVMYDPKTRDGALLRVQFEIAGPNQVSLVSTSAVALWTVNFSGDIHVVPIRHAEDRIRAARLPAITAALGSVVRVRP